MECATSLRTTFCVVSFSLGQQPVIREIRKIQLIAIVRSWLHFLCVIVLPVSFFIRYVEMHRKVSTIFCDKKKFRKNIRKSLT